MTALYFQAKWQCSSALQGCDDPRGEAGARLPPVPGSEAEYPGPRPVQQELAAQPSQPNVRRKSCEKGEIK